MLRFPLTLVTSPKVALFGFVEIPPNVCRLNAFRASARSWNRRRSRITQFFCNATFSLRDANPRICAIYGAALPNVYGYCFSRSATPSERLFSSQRTPDPARRFPTASMGCILSSTLDAWAIVADLVEPLSRSDPGSPGLHPPVAFRVSYGRVPVCPMALT